MADRELNAVGEPAASTAQAVSPPEVADELSAVAGRSAEEGCVRGVRADSLDPAEIGVFDIIYADPPWPYARKMFDPKSNWAHSSASHHYETMSVDDIGGLPVPSIAAQDCLLFLWATSPQLDVAMDVIVDWGFQYTTIAFVWDKKRVNSGWYTMSQCEMVLVAKRGRIPKPRGARNIRQFLSEKATEHSRKPEEIRRRIEAMFPEQRKIELFARGSVAPGWTAWGQEIVDA